MLTAKNRDQLRNPTLGNRVWATFTFLARTPCNARIFGDRSLCNSRAFGALFALYSAAAAVVAVTPLLLRRHNDNNSGVRM